MEESNRCKATHHLPGDIVLACDRDQGHSQIDHYDEFYGIHWWDEVSLVPVPLHPKPSEKKMYIARKEDMEGIHVRLTS